jgi:hypothetical protein
MVDRRNWVCRFPAADRDLHRIGRCRVSGALTFVHLIGAWAMVAYAVLLGAWGTFSYFRNHNLSGGFRSSFILMVGLTVVQGLFGLALLAFGNRPHELLHVVYGVFAALFLPAAYGYAQQGSRRREAAILAGAAWIVSIAYLRGFATG